MRARRCLILLHIPEGSMEPENQPIPDAALELLARLGTGIEYTESEPNGIVNLTESDVTDDDWGHLVFYPGFADLDLTMFQITDAQAPGDLARR